MLQQKKINRFNGGITDFPMEAPEQMFQTGDNILLSRMGQMISRFGSVCWDLTHTQLPSGNQRVGSLWNFNVDTTLMAQSGKKLYAWYSSQWNELQGPTGNAFFSAGTTANRVTGGDWKGHLILANDGTARPMKTFQTGATTYVNIPLGLPRFLENNGTYAAATTVTAEMATLGNDIQTKMIAHYADTTHAHGIYNGVFQGPYVTGSFVGAADTVSSAFLTAPALAAGNSLATAKTFVGQLISAYNSHYSDAVRTRDLRVYHINTQINAGQPNVSLSFNAVGTTIQALAIQLNEIQIKYNWHVRSFHGHNTNTPATDLASEISTASQTASKPNPFFTDLSYTPLINFVNLIKLNYNNHLSDGIAHNDKYSSAGTHDGPNLIQLANATDFNSMLELGAHCYCAYREHQADVELGFNYVSGKTYPPANNFIIDTVTPQNPVNGPPGSLANVQIGQFAVSALADGPFNIGIGGFAPNAQYPGSSFPVGTKVTAVDVANAKITFSQSNNGDGQAGGSVPMFLSFMKFHWIGLAVTDTNWTSDVQKGHLNDVDFNTLFTDIGAFSTMIDDVATKFNAHDSNFGFAPTIGGISAHIIGNTHQLDLTLAPKFQGHTYEYAFVYAYSYTTLSGEQFQMRGSPFFLTKNTPQPIENQPSLITGLSQVSNGASDNYDTSNIIVEIYRTVDNGQTLYLVGSVANGTSTFTDNISDAELISQAQLYTTGGVLPNDPPPICKFFHMTKAGLPLFGSVTQTLNDGTTETLVNAIQQGNLDQPDAAPGSALVFLPEPVTGISSIRSLPIAWTKNATYRLEGQFDASGRGELVPVAISERIGLAASFSPVQIDGAVVFASNDQFWMTDGYQMTPLGRSWPTTHGNLILNPQNIQGCFDRTTNRAWWGVTTSDGENNSCLILDFNQPIDQTFGGCWTTASNGNYFAPTALTVFNGQVIRGDSRGYVFKHDPSYSNDPRLDTTGAASSGAAWYSKTIIYNYLGPAHDFGLPGFRKWVSLIEAKFAGPGNLSAQLGIVNDLGRNSGLCTPIRARSAAALINERRYFPSGSLFGAYKQVSLTNAFVVITNSTTLGTGTLVQAAKTLTLGVAFNPTDCVDHVLTLSNDNYVTQYTITAMSNANKTITVLDPGGKLPVDGVYKWQVFGFPKDEFLQHQEHTLWWTQMGTNQTVAGLESVAAP